MRLYWIGLLLALSACAAPGKAEANGTPLEDLGAAPELTNETWLNVSAPLRLRDLRGQVVAIDMWTFG